ncbi:hypothetical protein QQS21_006026 [Conoideocrella luteorostrata]|uniref:Nucleoside phosphorylase domain-containing protein n=1 Tax=Conoideocrella luteorostrata TaxID=1105319 RepID=A0AAJ0FTB7_9HYPO|nr:hypothetical protein QQS21_006026 [Conoideocrella luteorostrata]
MLSQILAGDFAWTQSWAWKSVVCALFFTLTSFLWFRLIVSIQRLQGRRDPRPVEHGNSSSKDDADDQFITTNTAPEASMENASTTTSSRDERGKLPNESDCILVATTGPKQRLTRADYTVGWICAIPIELTAALALLDEEHEVPKDIPDDDENSYTLGKVEEHNIVIVILPDPGTAAAASVAKDLSRTFPNLRFGLMVGIGGGAPSEKHDVRLGDIVVSAPGNRNGGVFQYDYGKTIQNRAFHTVSFLNRPPTSLLTAMNGLKSRYEIGGNTIETVINSIIEVNSRLQEFKRPHSATDRLFKSDFVHPDDGASCTKCCCKNPRNMVSRTERTENKNTPTVHYGLIASANQVMKDALIRDKIIADMDVLCFEMEAAGLMNQFPCLVIRGICDYSDSHKNKDWQKYAALAAAAYAKDLLHLLTPRQIQEEEKMSYILTSKVHEGPAVRR